MGCNGVVPGCEMISEQAVRNAVVLVWYGRGGEGLVRCGDKGMEKEEEEKVSGREVLRRGWGAGDWVCAFFFNDTATTEIYALSLHDARPISVRLCLQPSPGLLLPA